MAEWNSESTMDSVSAAPLLWGDIYTLLGQWCRPVRKLSSDDPFGGTAFLHSALLQTPEETVNIERNGAGVVVDLTHGKTGRKISAVFFDGATKCALRDATSAAQAAFDLVNASTPGRAKLRETG